MMKNNIETKKKMFTRTKVLLTLMDSTALTWFLHRKITFYPSCILLIHLYYIRSREILFVLIILYRVYCSSIYHRM